MGTLQVIVGGQAGSEGKGAVCAQLAAPRRNPNGLSAVRVAGPNAGHSALDATGHRWPLRQIPVAAVINPEARLYIAAGSEIDISVLLREVEALEAAGHKIRDRLTIDPMATILEARHHHVEAAANLTLTIGSTGKGIGAARSDRIMRTAKLVRDTDLQDLCRIGDTATEMLADLKAGATLQVEGTQGHWLGLHHEFYPQVTSSNTRAIDFCAMAGVNPWAREVDDFEVWVVFRTRPIRVAGPSGPLPGETTWEALGLPPEYTTVTGKLRRVGAWDADRVRRAVRDNGGTPAVRVAITMLDQEFPDLAGVSGQFDMPELAFPAHPAVEWLDDREIEAGAPIRFVGTGPAAGVFLG